MSPFTKPKPNPELHQSNGLSAAMNRADELSPEEGQAFAKAIAPPLPPKEAAIKSMTAAMDTYGDRLKVVNILIFDLQQEASDLNDLIDAMAAGIGKLEKKKPAAKKVNNNGPAQPRKTEPKVC